MKLVFRVLAMLVAVPATSFFAYWLLYLLLPLRGQDWIAESVSLVCGIAAGWFVWTKLGTAPGGLPTCLLLGALIVGAIGFGAGFFGPMIFAPQANQGPLLGILITGPLGFLLGGVGGVVYWLVKARHRTGRPHD